MSNDWGLGDVITAVFSDAKADCKITQVSLHAHEGDPVYQTRAVFKVLEVEELEPVTESVLLATGAYAFGADNVGIYRSTPTEAWGRQATLSAVAANGAQAMVQADDGNVVLGNYFNQAGIWISQDLGLNWTFTWDLGNEVGVDCLIKLDTGTILAGTRYDSEIWRSADHGLTWTYIRALDSGGPINAVTAMAQAANGDVIAAWFESVAAVDAEVWRSQDDGLTWARLQTLTGLHDVFCMVTAQNGYMAAGGRHLGADGEFWYSTDNGATWAEGTTCTGNDYPVRMALLPDGNILAGTYNSTTGQAECWRSTDHGISWTHLSDIGDGTDGCWALCLDWDDAVVAGLSRDDGNSAEIWRSSDGGASWVEQYVTVPYEYVDALLLATG